MLKVGSKFILLYLKRIHLTNKYYNMFFSHNILFFILVNTAKASADLAYTLQAALMTQQIKEQETQVMVIERRQEIELQEQVKKQK
jgi:hypothetical protein